MKKMSLSSSTLLDIAKALHLSNVHDIEQKYQSVSIQSVEEFLKLVLTIGTAGGRAQPTKKIVFDLDERINIIKHKLKFIQEEAKPTVLSLTNIKPPIFETNPYLTNIISIAGAKVYDTAFANGEHVNPDILLIISHQMEGSFGELASLLSLDQWKNTNAVRNNAVFLLNGQKHFRGFGLQLADDIEMLAEIVYPQYLTFGGNGESWIQFET